MRPSSHNPQFLFTNNISQNMMKFKVKMVVYVFFVNFHHFYVNTIMLTPNASNISQDD